MIGIKPFEYVPLDEPPSLSFSCLGNSSAFRSIVEGILDKKNFSRSLEKSDRICEVLLEDKKTPVGLIVYKKTLKKGLEALGSCFELKDFNLINSEKKIRREYEKVLLNRVLKLAKRASSEGVILKISEISHLLGFFTSRDFKITKSRSIESEETHRKILIHLPLSSKRSDPAPVLDSSVAPSVKAGLVAESRDKLGDRSQDSDRKPHLKRLREEDALPYPNAKVRAVEKEISVEEQVPLSARQMEVRSQRLEMPRRVSEPSLRPPPPRTHNLPMKGTIYFEYIMSGKKKYEGRVCGYACNSMRAGDHLKLFDRRAGWGIICEIIGKDEYRGFEEMLRDKGVLPMLPQLEGVSKRLSSEGLLGEGVRVYQSFPGSQRVHQHGAVAIGVKFLEKIYR